MTQLVIFDGNLGQDPVSRFTPTGKQVVSFSVASNRRWRDAQGNLVEQVTWYQVSVWGKLGEACFKYLAKGSPVLVTGQLRPDQASGRPEVWKRQDGSWGANYDVTASEVRFLGARREGVEDTSGEGEPSAVVDTSDESDLPF